LKSEGSSSASRLFSRPTSARRRIPRGIEAVLDRMLGVALRSWIDRRVAERMREFTAATARMEAALRGAHIHVFFQDRDLRYLSVISPQGEEAGAQLIGRTDEQVLPATERDTVIAAKRRVIATGEPAECDVSYVTPHGRTLFALHVAPDFGSSNTIEGITSTAVDVTRVRSLESEQRRLSDELKTAVQRYELALRDSNVTVFTQDRDLRYTSISNPLGGLAAADIIGRSDDTIVTEASRDSVVALKRRCLDGGSSQQGECALDFAGGGVRWFEFHLEPLHNLTGEITGLLGAAIDVTRRKEDDAHLRLLLRELTHRSKNLLAVIQAVARQTARHAGSIEKFVEQFDARLQALATSHDVLIEEGWHGASLGGLARLQLKPFLEMGDRVSIDGPTVLLKPEAAQALGLALHELANNAEKHGSLSVPGGKVAMTWRRVPYPEGDGVAINWTETGGPMVTQPVARRFGCMVIERNLAVALGAKVNLAFLAGGVECDITIPPTQFIGAVLPTVEPTAGGR
jgi:PAS domain S-box-containing protein